MDESARTVRAEDGCFRPFRMSKLVGSSQSAAAQRGQRRRQINDNSKLQAAIDELERLYATVQSFKARNGTLPNPDSDAGRAVFALETFAGELKQLHIGKLVYVGM